MHSPRGHEKIQNQRDYIGRQVTTDKRTELPKPTALQHSETSENNDNSLKQAERVIATTKSVNEILNEKLKQAEASIGKLKFDLDKERKRFKAENYLAKQIQKDYIDATENLKAMKLRAEAAEKKAVDFDSILKTVRQERDYQVKSYRKFLVLRNILEEYDKLNGLKIGVPDTEKDSEPSK